MEPANTLSSKQPFENKSGKKEIIFQPRQAQKTGLMPVFLRREIQEALKNSPQRLLK